MRDLKLVHLFTAVLAGFWIAFIAIAGTSWWALVNSGESLRDVHDDHMQKAEMLAQIALGVEGGRLEVLRTWQHDPASPLVAIHDHPIESHFKGLAARDEKMAALWQRLQASSNHDEERQAVAEALKLRAAWEAKLKHAVDAIKRGDYSVPVMGAFLLAGRTEGQLLMDALEALRAWHGQSARLAAEAAAEAQRQVGWLLAALLLVFCLPATWLSWVTLRRLKQGFHRAGSLAQAIAAGDLGQRVNGQGRDEIGELMTHLSHMQDKLVHVIGEVRQVADGIGTASAQVAAGNADLSQRTESTASSLQQTAASTEQLASTVRQNASHAQQASELATGASGVAARGGEAVGQVVHTMREINASSQRIADIIGVIDGIAFQTNILALNAAVEAARAGEQGRGFAVVASEVRSLAQRSAGAAREIKGLIQASVERVEAGTRQADDAGQTMTEVVDSIRRVSDIVAEISQASREQSEGVSQVGAAVTQMDQATQQNAALVEESAAAAESLRAQAQQLVNAVAVFRLAA